MSLAGRSDRVRVLLVADTHIGFDLPARPRIERRRRGHDFLANFERALAPAHAGEVDLVVHGGDLLHRSKLPTAVVETALRPLVRVAEAGVPTFVVPGNHERSLIPNLLLTAHPNLHVFNHPGTVRCDLGHIVVAVSAFPFARRIADEFKGLLEHARQPVGADRGQGIRDGAGLPDVNVLCIHQTVEGAQVGPSDYTFRRGRDIIPGRAIPNGFAAVLSGHIHRSQTMTHDLTGRLLAAPVIYPGSVERTSIAERDEDKHYAVLELAADDTPGGRLVGVDYRSLPARPMVTLELEMAGADGNADAVAIERDIRRRLAVLPEDAVVRVRVDDPAAVALSSLSARRLRELAPPTMNIDLSVPRPRPRPQTTMRSGR